MMSWSQLLHVRQPWQQWGACLLAILLPILMLQIRVQLPIAFGERPLLVLFMLPIIVCAVFAVAQMLVFTLLGLVVPSSSGLAVLSMPIMAPLADTVMIPRYIVVSAYNWGQYAMLFLAPTGLVLVTLQMLGIQFNQWVRFVLPMVGFVLGFGALMLVVQVMLI
ncbi:hypothetical protein [Aeromonas salmonicida]|uniref:hypothetical protein n=1 Tax=Aeromonas salmonicida TaxID=645 RepID=UPI001F4F69D0|nr:hypothetical protein [Aeromonas salmonicida]